MPLVAEAALAAAYASPARFVYHPRERARPRAFRKLSDGDQLLVGERGERWQYSPKNRWLRPGAILAPEPLIAVLGETSAFSFIGASGTAYVARDPLGPFERSSAPVEALTSVSAAGTSIIGVRQTRSLLRSGDFGVSWQNVGPRGESVVSVGIEASGLGYALVTPEAVYETHDFGDTWQKLDAASVGALELVTAFDGKVRALTPLGERAFDRGEKRWRSALPVAPPSATWPSPPRGPDAAALGEGRAVIVNGSYYELVAATERGTWDTVSGPLGGPYQRKPFLPAKGCKAVRVAAFEQWLVFACFKEAAESLSQPIELHRGGFTAERFERLPGRLDGTLSAFRLSVGASGHWIASGVCPPGVAGTGCAPSGIQRERSPDEGLASGDETTKKRALNSAGALAAAPSLSNVALALAFSTDGRSAYAVGRRSKTGRFALFVSRDAGRTFAPRDLDLGQVASDDSDDDMVERSPGTRVDSLSAAEDGAVAIAFSHYGRRTLVVTDDQGKLLSASEPPEERALIGASGLRAIAIAHKSRQVWESLDGGVTFEPAGTLPLELCPNEEGCDVPVRCAPSGCVIGRELTRVGWGGISADEAVILPPPLRPLRQLAERRVSTPISCALDSGRFTPLPGVGDAPRAHDSQIGKAAWFVVADDPAHAAATIFVGRKGRVEPQSLLEPASHPEQRAYAVLSQVEGVAAVRYRLPEAQPGKASLTDVEIAAQNFIEGQTVRARIADGGAYSPGDYTTSSSHTPQAQPDLVSIASGGVYLRLHQSARADQPTFFLDGRHVETIPAVEWPVDSRFPARAEMVRIGAANVPILFVGRGAAIARARRTGAAWDFEAFATGMVDPASFGLVSFDNIAYVGNRAGLYLETQDGTGTIASAQIYPFRPDGALVDPPVLVPTQLGLGEHPTACDAERRAHTPRIVAAYQPGTRHPIVVNDNVEGPRTLLTAFAVLHGTPEAPCVASYEAVGLSADTGQATRETALILMDDLEHSVLFRRGAGDAGQVSYRHMSCRFDPAVEVPPEVYRALP
ncbi:MAG TPA: hypothetical protein VFQ35_07830 [Polyangiaceae bacterium]|nr:hypothetical protein [Polyangiaceae bacterium]